MEKRYEIVLLALGELLINQAEKSIIKDYEIESLRAKIERLEKSENTEKS